VTTIGFASVLCPRPITGCSCARLAREFGPAGDLEDFVGRDLLVSSDELAMLVLAVPGSTSVTSIPNFAISGMTPSKNPSIPHFVVA
jgi:hypothetical protein